METKATKAEEALIRAAIFAVYGRPTFVNITEVTGSYQEFDRRIHIDVPDENIALLIGKNGHTKLQLQHILGVGYGSDSVQIVYNINGDETFHPRQKKKVNKKYIADFCREIEKYVGEDAMQITVEATKSALIVLAKGEEKLAKDLWYPITRMIHVAANAGGFPAAVVVEPFDKALW